MSGLAPGAPVEGTDIGSCDMQIDPGYQIGRSNYAKNFDEICAVVARGFAFWGLCGGLTCGFWAVFEEFILGGGGLVLER